MQDNFQIRHDRKFQNSHSAQWHGSVPAFLRMLLSDAVFHLRIPERFSEKRLFIINICRSPMDPNPFAVLSFIVAPAILTNASSVLIMSTSNRP